MQCVKPCVALLSNYEVYKYLSSLPPPCATVPKHTKKPGVMKEKDLDPGTLALHRMQVQVTTSLTHLTDLQPSWSEEQLQQCLQRLSTFALLKGEKLHIINTRPNNLVSLYTCIEDADARFSNDALLEILSILDTYLPLPSLDAASSQVPEDQDNGDDMEV